MPSPTSMDLNKYTITAVSLYWEATTWLILVSSTQLLVQYTTGALSTHLMTHQLLQHTETWEPNFHAVVTNSWQITMIPEHDLDRVKLNQQAKVKGHSVHTYLKHTHGTLDQLLYLDHTTTVVTNLLQADNWFFFKFYHCISLQTCKVLQPQLLFMKNLFHVHRIKHSWLHYGSAGGQSQDS